MRVLGTALAVLCGSAGAASVASRKLLSLHHQQLPDRPQQPMVVTKTTDSVTVQWTPPAADGGPIDMYEVEYRQPTKVCARYPR